jgi:hypothetical protein
MRTDIDDDDCVVRDGEKVRALYLLCGERGQPAQ